MVQIAQAWDPTERSQGLHGPSEVRGGHAPPLTLKCFLLLPASRCPQSPHKQVSPHLLQVRIHFLQKWKNPNNITINDLSSIPISPSPTLCLGTKAAKEPCPRSHSDLGLSPAGHFTLSSILKGKETTSHPPALTRRDLEGLVGGDCSF